LTFGIAGLVAGRLLSNRLSAAATSYGEDRAQIEDLQARYLFALDFHDPQLYASTFTPDGILDYGEGDVKGRDAIVKGWSRSASVVGDHIAFVPPLNGGTMKRHPCFVDRHNILSTRGRSDHSSAREQMPDG